MTESEVTKQGFEASISDRVKSESASPEVRKAECGDIVYGDRLGFNGDSSSQDGLDYATSHVVMNSQVHDLETQAVLDAKFPPATVPTIGLERPATPPSPERPRYYRLMEQCIDPLMIAPLDTQHIENASRLVPEVVRHQYKGVLKYLEKVC